MSIDPNKKGYRYEKEQMLKLVNLNEQQAEIIELYILEEQTGKRHWEWDPEDHNIYIEYLNGTNKLRTRINNIANMDKRQKAMYNYGVNPDGSSNDNSFEGQQAKAGQKGTVTTSSGRVLDKTTAPNLFPANKRHHR